MKRNQYGINMLPLSSLSTFSLQHFECNLRLFREFLVHLHNNEWWYSLALINAWISFSASLCDRLGEKSSPQIFQFSRDGTQKDFLWKPSHIGTVSNLWFRIFWWQWRFGGLRSSSLFTDQSNFNVECHSYKHLILWTWFVKQQCAKKSLDVD